MHTAHNIIKFATHWMHAHTPNSYHDQIFYTNHTIITFAIHNMHTGHNIIKFATHWMHAHIANSYHDQICYTETQTSVLNDIFGSVSSHLFYWTHCQLGSNQHYPSIIVSKLPRPHLTSSIWMYWDHCLFYFHQIFCHFS